MLYVDIYGRHNIGIIADNNKARGIERGMDMEIIILIALLVLVKFVNPQNAGKSIVKLIEKQNKKTAKGN